MKNRVSREFEGSEAMRLYAKERQVASSSKNHRKVPWLGL